MEKNDEFSTGDVHIPLTEKARLWYRALPDKKRYLEFVTAFLSIPVLITVLISNVSSLQNTKKSETAAPTAAPVPVTIVMQPTTPEQARTITTPVPTNTPTSTPQACTPGIGSIELTYPTEGSVISRDPVCVELTRKNTNYCSVTWSYRINNGAWSDYTDKQICMYGLSSGSKLLDVRVKSALTGDEIILERSFTVAGITPTPTPATQSAILRRS